MDMESNLLSLSMMVVINMTTAMVDKVVMEDFMVHCYVSKYLASHKNDNPPTGQKINKYISKSGWDNNFHFVSS